MKNSSYTVILDWMLDLGLSSRELLAYATIYGFSMDGESEFTGSRSYLCRKMAVESKRTVDGVLQGLIEKGLIIKRENTVNGVRFCMYRANMEAVSTRAEICTGGANSAPGGGANSAPNNKDNKIKISISNIARESGIDWVNKETWDLLETLALEPKWRKKTENAMRLSIKKLSGFPEVEAAEMIRKAIANGWQGLFELHEDERARLYGQNSSFQGNYQAPRRQAETSRKGGIDASEEIVRAAMAEFNN